MGRITYAVRQSEKDSVENKELEEDLLERLGSGTVGMVSHAT